MRIFLAFLFFAQVLVHSTSISENIVADWTMRDNSTSATQTIQNALDFVKNNIRRTAKYVQIADHTISFPYERGPLVSALRIRYSNAQKMVINASACEILNEDKIKPLYRNSWKNLANTANEFLKHNLAALYDLEENELIEIEKDSSLEKRTLQHLKNLNSEISKKFEELRSYILKKAELESELLSTLESCVEALNFSMTVPTDEVDESRVWKFGCYLDKGIDKIKKASDKVVGEIQETENYARNLINRTDFPYDGSETMKYAKTNFKEKEKNGLKVPECEFLMSKESEMIERKTMESLIENVQDFLQESRKSVENLRPKDSTESKPTKCCGTKVINESCDQAKNNLQNLEQIAANVTQKTSELKKYLSSKENFEKSLGLKVLNCYNALNIPWSLS